MTRQTDALDVLLPSPYTDVPFPAGEDEAPDATAVARGFARIVHTLAVALDWARGQVNSPTRDWYRLCLSFVRQAWGLPAVYPSAIAAWQGATQRHRTVKAADIPKGAPVFWAGGTWGHVALSLGDGTCLSNDVRRKGRIDRVRIDAISEAWGFALLGYTRDLNGYDLPVPAPAKPKPTRVSNAHAKGRELLAILDAAVANGRRGTVRRVRDDIRRALKGLPKR